MYTALAGAVGALYGPLHGGANEVLSLHYSYELFQSSNRSLDFDSGKKCACIL